MKLKFGTLIPLAICFCVKHIIALNVRLSHENDLSSSPSNSPGQKRIVCYLKNGAESRFDSENDIDPNICSHIIYAFAKFDDNGTIVFGDKYADHNDADYSWGKG